MIELNVYFNNDSEFNGQALLINNLMTGKVTLHLKEELFLKEVNKYIDQAVGILKRSFDIVNVNVHWDSVKKEGKLYE